MLNTKSIGNKIAAARKKAYLSQAALAELVSISAQAVGKWERGESMPDIMTLNRLAEILGVDLNYFSATFQSSSPEITGDKPIVNQSVELPATKQKNKLSWDMSLGNWVGADFSGLKNLKEKFSASNMKRCKFVGSDLSGLLLKSNNVENCDFSGSDLNGSQVQNSNLANNVFKDCSLKATAFSGSYICLCDFTNADLTGMVIKTGSIEKSTFDNVVWNRTSFIDTHIANVVFSGTIEDCYFENCGFTKVTFQNAILTNTFFKCRSLKKIKFIDCQADRMTYEFLKNGKAELKGLAPL